MNYLALLWGVRSSHRTPLLRSSSIALGRRSTALGAHGPLTTWVRRCLWATGLSLLAPLAWAQGGGSGTIEGLVQNAASGEFLNNARVVVVGTNVETSTNAIGEYRLQVPVGEAVTLSVSFTGMESQRATVRVVPGQRVQQDFSLVLTRGSISTEGGVVQLDAYTVQDREMTGQAIALQEQRNAPNIKNVISLEEFGDMGEGNVGEFLKYVPGISIAYNPQTPQSASIRGMPATGTLVMMNGTEMASSGDNTRTFDFGLSASGNVDRIEISKVPTPEMPANAVGGSINIIPKSSFSRRTPQLSYNAFLAFNALGGVEDIDFSFSKKAGPDPKSTGRHMQPAFNLSYILPINRSLGFTFALSKAERISDWEFYFNTWDRVQGIQTQNRMGALMVGEDRELASISVDWKLWDRHVFSASFQGTNQTNFTRQMHLPVTAGANATGDGTYTQGAPAGVGSVAQLFNTWTGQYKTLRHSTMTYRYDSALWKIDGDLAWSKGGLRRKHADDGFFINITTSLPNLIVRYDGIDSAHRRRVARVTATDRAGNPVDVFDGDNYLVTAVQDNPLKVDDQIWRAALNVRREFDFKVPVALKIGGLVNSQVKDSVGGAWSMSFTPPPGGDGTDGRLARHHDLIAEDFSDRRSFTDAFGSEVKARWISPYKMYNLFQTRPEWFTYSAANAAGWHTSRTNTSKKLDETISAAYIRGDVKLVNNRLWLVAGVRFERTDDKGWGPKNDLWAVYQRDADGNFVRNAAGQLVFRTTDVYERARQQYTERGSYTERSYDGFFPSFNSSYNITENLIVRAAYARTIGRPNLNEIIPGFTIPSPDAPEATRRITVINSGLTPWTANNYDFTVESYGIKDAVATFSLFRKDLSDFFGQVITEATPELLAEFGLPMDYLDYDIVTKRNFGEAVIDGFEIAYRQTLDRWMPDWGRGVQVYFNLTKLKLSGANQDDFTNFSPRDISWGVSYVRRRFIGKVNVALASKIRGARAAASAIIPEGSYNYTGAQTRIDVSAEYRFNRRLSLYGSARNLMASSRRIGIDGPGVPEYAKWHYYSYTGAMFTFGVKGTF